MKKEELQARLAKAQENVEKRLNTIERHKAQLAKLQAKLTVCDWIDLDKLDSLKYEDGARARYKAETGDDLYWNICDIEHKQDDIKESYKKLEELKQIVENWKEKLSKVEAHDEIWNREIPDSFTSYKDKLVAEWDAWDKKRQENLSKQLDKLGYREFVKEYKYSEYQFVKTSDEEIHNQNEREATNLILDLYARVVKYIGKVTDWKGLHINQFHLNGYIVGELGTCKVESILAGGYNVQRLHVRVLVHKYDGQPEPVKAEESKAVETDGKLNFNGMTIEQLEKLVAEVGGTCKKYNNEKIYRMRLVMAVKKASIAQA